MAAAKLSTAVAAKSAGAGREHGAKCAAADGLAVSASAVPLAPKPSSAMEMIM